MKEINNFWWPDNDKDCHPAVLQEVYKINLLDQYLKDKKVCIQAGGNVGVFPKKLAQDFDVVYTFEPDPYNFECLAKNCPEPNIIKFQSALGKDHKMITVGVSRPDLKNNCGAYQVIGDGFTPTIMIDDLDLPSCDLIYLDIEGYELFALQGAIKTIEKFHPVIVIENKDLPLMYGTTPDEVLEYLICNGYKIAERVQRDVILI